MTHPEDRALIAEQERELGFTHFDAHTAWTIGNILRDLALLRSHPLVIDIRRFGSPAQILFHAELPGTTPDNSRWVDRKANVVARFHRSSYALGLHLAELGMTFTEKYALSEADYATHGGAFPITLIGTGIIGSITVSGLPQRDDHALVIEALCLHLNRDYANLRLA